MGATCVCHMTETHHQQRGQRVAQTPQDTEHQPGGAEGQSPEQHASGTLSHTTMPCPAAHPQQLAFFPALRGGRWA